MCQKAISTMLVLWSPCIHNIVSHFLHVCQSHSEPRHLKPRCLNFKAKGLNKTILKFFISSSIKRKRKCETSSASRCVNAETKKDCVWIWDVTFWGWVRRQCVKVYICFCSHTKGDWDFKSEISIVEEPLKTFQLLIILITHFSPASAVQTRNALRKYSCNL